MGIITATIWVIRVIIVLTKYPDPPIVPKPSLSNTEAGRPAKFSPRFTDAA